MTKESQLLRKVQRKIDKIARGFDFQSSEKVKNFRLEVEKVRKQVNVAYNDSFFTHNSQTAMMIGTILMWFGYAHVASGLNSEVTTNVVMTTRILLNMLLAGTGGAVGAHFMSKMMIFFKLRKEKGIFESYVNFGIDFEQQKAIANQKKLTYHINLDVRIDILLVCRGIIAGCVAISISPSNYFIWTALLNGIAGGALYVFSCRILKIFGLDDTTHISHCHGAISFYSLFSICVFHRKEGFLFKRAASGASAAVLQSTYENIMVIIGSNCLAIITIAITIAVLLFLFAKLIVSRFARVSKDVELMGQDTFAKIQHDLKLLDHVQELINVYYPDNIGDYLLSKYSLLMKVKHGNKAAQSRLDSEDVNRLKFYIEKMITLQQKREKGIDPTGHPLGRTQSAFNDGHDFQIEKHKILDPMDGMNPVSEEYDDQETKRSMDHKIIPVSSEEQTKTNKGMSDEDDEDRDEDESNGDDEEQSDQDEDDDDDDDDGEVTMNSGLDESSRSNHRKFDDSTNLGSIGSIKKKHVEIGIEDLH